jgi:hypothetical protein
METTYRWILDSGGAGRGAWQGGVLYEFMRWCRLHGRYPRAAMGASVGGYAAADVATGTEETVMKGWRHWGTPARRGPKYGRFRDLLVASTRYVMAERELEGVFDADPPLRLLIFTTRLRRLDGRPFERADRLRFFLKAAMRKLPAGWKYLPSGYAEDPVIFAHPLPPELRSERVRPLARGNYHRVIEASCLIPVAMGRPLAPGDLGQGDFPGDRGAVFIDGGYTLKMPLARFESDPALAPLARWAAADRTLVFCCDPEGALWETSSRLRRLDGEPAVRRALRENRLLVIRPDHRVEAGFLCMDNATALRTFERGREQARRLLRSAEVLRFLEG